ncbi:hypothetical protein GCM10008949_25330 [Deinococcus humi]|nr:hypothetical protein GCM10008949_25330 [Deinococcus humi]
MVASFEGGGDAGSGMAGKIRDPGVQRAEVLQSPPSFKAERAASLLPGGAMGLFNPIVVRPVSGSSNVV